MKKFLLFILIFPIVVICEDTKVIISPGIKVGYAFGEKGGFIFGYEISLVQYSGSGNGAQTLGAVIAYDMLKTEDRLHLGLETTFVGLDGVWKPFGIEIGPTFVFRETTIIVGLHITPYYGALLIPYYRIIILHNENIQSETGAFLKLPIILKGRFNLSG